MPLNLLRFIKDIRESCAGERARDHRTAVRLGGAKAPPLLLARIHRYDTTTTTTTTLSTSRRSSGGMG